MIKIEEVANNNINVENIATESLVKIIVENFDPSIVFNNPGTAETARQIYVSTSVHEKIVEISEKLRELTQEYNEEKIAGVFKTIIGLDQQLFVDIITAAYLVAIKYDDKKYIENMFKLRHFIDDDKIIYEDVEEGNEAPISEEEIAEGPIELSEEDVTEVE